MHRRVKGFLTWRTAAAIGLSMVAVSGCEPTTSNWSRVEPAIPATAFTLPQLSGGESSLSELKGRVVIVEFWATWCGPCHYSTPSLEAIYRQYRERGVTVLLINEGDTPEQVRAWAGRRFTAPILLDRDGAVGGRYGVRSIPRLFVIDQRGLILYDESGYRGGLERNLQLILERLLVPSSAHA